jgi:hypothetical protein
MPYLVFLAIGLILLFNTPLGVVLLVLALAYYWYTS